MLFQLTMTTYVYLIPIICPTQWLHRTFGCVWGFVCPSRATPLYKSTALLTSPEQQKVGRIKISCVCELFVLNSKKFTIKILVLGNYRLHFCYEVEIPLICLNYLELGFTNAQIN